MENRRGFTLLELLVVIAIVGLLATAAAAALNIARIDSRNAVRVADARQIQQAAELYYDEHESYPYPNISAFIGKGIASSIGGDAFWGGENCGMYPESLACFVSPYITLPYDPINDFDYPYYYMRNTLADEYAILFYVEGDHPLRCDAQAVPYSWGPYVNLCNTALIGKPNLVLVTNNTK